jgi:hypothetical protein
MSETLTNRVEQRIEELDSDKSLRSDQVRAVCEIVEEEFEGVNSRLKQIEDMLGLAG